MHPRQRLSTLQRQLDKASACGTLLLAYILSTCLPSPGFPPRPSAMCSLLSAPTWGPSPPPPACTALAFPSAPMHHAGSCRHPPGGLHHHHLLAQP